MSEVGAVVRRVFAFDFEKMTNVVEEGSRNQFLA
jgi:hypothetical protein